MRLRIGRARASADAHAEEHSGGAAEPAPPKIAVSPAVESFKAASDALKAREAAQAARAATPAPAAR